MDVRAGRWWRSWTGESKPLKASAPGGCLACIRSISSLDISSFYRRASPWIEFELQLGALFHPLINSECSWKIIPHHGMVEISKEDHVSREGITSRSGQASKCVTLLCIVDDRSRCDGQPSRHRRLIDYPTTFRYGCLLGSFSFQYFLLGLQCVRTHTDKRHQYYMYAAIHTGSNDLENRNYLVYIYSVTRNILQQVL